MADATAVSSTAAAVAKVKQMEQAAARSREETRTQIVAVIEGHVAELKELGFDYRLIEGDNDAKPAKKCARCGGDHSTRSCPTKNG